MINHVIDVLTNKTYTHGEFVCPPDWFAYKYNWFVRRVIYNNSVCQCRRRRRPTNNNIVPGPMRRKVVECAKTRTYSRHFYFLSLFIYAFFFSSFSSCFTERSDRGYHLRSRSSSASSSFIIRARVKYYAYISIKTRRTDVVTPRHLARPVAYVSATFSPHAIYETHGPVSL